MECCDGRPIICVRLFRCSRVWGNNYCSFRFSHSLNKMLAFLFCWESWPMGQYYCKRFFSLIYLHWMEEGIKQNYNKKQSLSIMFSRISDLWIWLAILTGFYAHLIQLMTWISLSAGSLGYRSEQLGWVEFNNINWCNNSVYQLSIHPFYF